MAPHPLARRRAQILVGQLGVAWSAMVVLAGVAVCSGYGRGLPTLLLLAAAPLLAVVWGIAKRWSQRRAEVSLEAFLAAQEVEQDSLHWPLLAAALLGPLTLHAWLWGLFFWLGGHSSLADFDEWLLYSLLFSLVAHVALAVAFVGHAHRLSATRLGAQPRLHGAVGKAVTMVTLAGLVPGVLVLGIPTVLIWMTAALLVPIAFWVAESAFRESRADLLVALFDGEARPGALEAELAELLAAPEARRDETLVSALGLLESVTTRGRLRGHVNRFLDAALEPEGRARPRSLELALTLAADHAIHVPDDTCRALARHEDAEVALRAVDLLSGRPGRGTEATLEALLRSPHVRVQLAATRALG
ncbi:MAG: HEAT repeat domain-containing protein, partial [Myxococcales bacterium]|nr:HEAT repeat domain-containing protein [Myxococcales bacterium]